MQAWLKKPLVRIMVVVILVVLVSQLLRGIDIPSCPDLRDPTHLGGVLAPWVLFLTFVLASVFFLPGSIFALLAGLLLGPVKCTLLVVLGSTLGSLLAFFIARFLARDWLYAWMQRKSWFQHFAARVEEQGFLYVLLVRIIPIVPYNALNYACGLLPLRWQSYLFATLMGLCPGALAVTFIGSQGCVLIEAVMARRWPWEALADGAQSFLSLLLALTSLLVAGAIGLILRRSKP